MTSAFQKSVGLLLELHQLYLRGQDEGAEADAIRDAMDPPSQAMTEQERRLVLKLSAHLYNVGDRSMVAPPALEVQHAFARARKEERWEEVLDLLRDHPGLAAPRDRSLLRGQAWAGLGAREAAEEFYRDAASSVPVGPGARPPAVAESNLGTPERPRRKFPKLRPAA